MNASRVVYTAGILAVAADLWNNYGNPHLPGYGSTLDPDKYAVPVPEFINSFDENGNPTFYGAIAPHFYLVIGAILIVLSFFAFSAERTV